MSEWLSVWIGEWISEWIGGRMDEWVSEWVLKLTHSTHFRTGLTDWLAGWLILTVRFILSLLKLKFSHLCVHLSLLPRSSHYPMFARLHSAVGCASDYRSRGRKFEFQLDHRTCSWRLIMKSFHNSKVIPLPLIQKRQLSVTGEFTFWPIRRLKYVLAKCV